MTWHLKDREFEKKLNEKAPPILNFTTALNVRMARIPSEALKNTLSVQDWHLPDVSYSRCRSLVWNFDPHFYHFGLVI